MTYPGEGPSGDNRLLHEEEIYVSDEYIGSGHRKGYYVKGIYYCRHLQPYLLMLFDPEEVNYISITPKPNQAGCKRVDSYYAA